MFAMGRTIWKRFRLEAGRPVRRLLQQSRGQTTRV